MSLLAFGAKGSPAVVMSIVFAGAPVLNAIYSLVLHPPAGGWSKVPIQFVLGILLAAVGGCLVTLYKPGLRRTSPNSSSNSAGGFAEPRSGRAGAVNGPTDVARPPRVAVDKFPDRSQIEELQLRKVRYAGRYDPAG